MADHAAATRAIRERWRANAGYWITIIRERRDRYRTELTDAALLDAIGGVADLRVLDAGCGEGYLSRTLASWGAEVVGIDACRDLVEAARHLPADDGSRVPYVHGSAEALPFADGSFDLVACNHLFSHLREASGPIAEFGRVVRSGGRLISLTLHPCFYTAHAERGAGTAVPASLYFQERGIEQHFLVDGLESPAPITSWVRPLEIYSRALRDAGFVIADLREPHPPEDRLRDDPWWRAGFQTPLFLLLVAERR